MHKKFQMIVKRFFKKVNPNHPLAITNSISSFVKILPAFEIFLPVLNHYKTYKKREKIISICCFIDFKITL